MINEHYTLRIRSRLSLAFDPNLNCLQGTLAQYDELYSETKPQASMPPKRLLQLALILLFKTIVGEQTNIMVWMGIISVERGAHSADTQSLLEA